MPHRDVPKSPPPLEPDEDVTPLRVMIPDYVDTFPCWNCGKPNRCPPVAKPVHQTTTAIKPHEPKIVKSIAPELEPDRGQAETQILPAP